MSEYTLKLFVQGFFLYPLAGYDRTCAAFVAPRVTDGPEHVCYLEGFPDLPAVSPPVLPLALRRCAVRIGKPANASTEEFHLVPQFESLRCGTQVRPEWHKKTKHIECAVTLGGGTLVAQPDDYTKQYCWEWVDCSGRRVSRRVTSVVHYELGFDAPLQVDIAEIASGGTNHTLTIASDAWLHLVHRPLDATAGEESVDDAHIESTENLCDPDGSGSHKYGDRVDCPKLVGPERHQSVEDAIRRMSPYFKGRPNCGARQMTLY